MKDEYSFLVKGKTDLRANSHSYKQFPSTILIQLTKSVESAHKMAINDLNSPLKSSAHYYVDNKGIIWGGLPEGYVANYNRNENGQADILIKVSPSKVGEILSSQTADSVANLLLDLVNRFDIDFGNEYISFNDERIEKQVERALIDIHVAYGLIVMNNQNQAWDPKTETWMTEEETWKLLNE